MAQELVDEIRVILDAMFIHRIVATTKWDDARPGKREAVGVYTVGLHQRHIFTVKIISSHGVVGRAAIGNFARGVAESIPDGNALAIFVPGSFDLCRGGSISMEEVGSKDTFQVFH